MSYRALIVDDDPMIVEVLCDALDSLGHAHDSAGCQESARQRLAEARYDYVLLDLEIPVRNGRFSRIENGINLLEEIRRRELTPVIVVTCNGTDGYEIPVQVMKVGAAGFVAKPHLKGLDRTIKEVVAKPPLPNISSVIETASGTATEPTPFAGGDMIFCPDRIELCGVKIISDKGMGHSMAMLEALAETDRRGRFVRLSAEQLVTKLNPDNGVNSITACAATIRANISKRLLKHENIACGANDVLAHDNQGYYLSGRVTVRRNAGTDPLHVPGDTSDDPGVTANVPRDIPDATLPLSPRQEWVLQQLRSGVKLTRGQIEREHRISSKTAKRDLADLSSRGMIQFIPRPSPGHYALKS